MRRGTTPTYERTYPEDLTGGTVNFCFWQGSNETVIPAEVTPTDYGSLLSVTLSQEQTLSFELGIVYWQIRAIKNGEAIASEVYGEVVQDAHPNGVIEEPVTLSSAPEEKVDETTESVDETTESVDETEESVEETEEPSEENWEDWQEREDDPVEESEEGEE